MKADSEPSFTLITGASSGIGEAIALDLSPTFDLILHGRDASRLEAVLSRCARPGSHQVWNCDLAAVAKTGTSLQEFLVKRELQVQGFIHCAGMVKVSALRLSTLHDMQKIFAVNLFSAMAIVQSLLARNTGTRGLRQILLISSAASLRGEKGVALYAATKGALDALVKSLSVELAPAVRVNAVLPGLIETKMTVAALRNPELQNQVDRNYPLGIGHVQDVVNTVRYLISDDARWITGALWAVDGGRTAA